MKKLKFNKIDGFRIIKKNFIDSIKAKKKFLRSVRNIKNLIKISKIIKNKYQEGGKIYFAGNGGSASDSNHLSSELISRLSKNRNAIPSGSLNENISLITAIANDYSYNKIFKRQIESNLNDNDIFFSISTSGNSKNIIEALKICKKKKIISILLTGKSGGIAKKYSDLVINVPSTRTQTIQEVHILIGHCICQILEDSIII
jgi:D-sedoheptulose 7-phosphate isomerase